MPHVGQEMLTLSEHLISLPLGSSWLHPFTIYTLYITECCNFYDYVYGLMALVCLPGLVWLLCLGLILLFIRNSHVILHISCWQTAEYWTFTDGFPAGTVYARTTQNASTAQVLSGVWSVDTSGVWTDQEILISCSSKFGLVSCNWRTARAVRPNIFTFSI